MQHITTYLTGRDQFLDRRSATLMLLIGCALLQACGSASERGASPIGTSIGNGGGPSGAMSALQRLIDQSTTGDPATPQSLNDGREYPIGAPDFRVYGANAPLPTDRVLVIDYDNDAAVDDDSVSLTAYNPIAGTAAMPTGGTLDTAFTALNLDRRDRTTTQPTGATQADYDLLAPDDPANRVYADNVVDAGAGTTPMNFISLQTTEYSVLGEWLSDLTAYLDPTSNDYSGQIGLFHFGLRTPPSEIPLTASYSGDIEYGLYITAGGDLGDLDAAGTVRAPGGRYLLDTNAATTAVIRLRVTDGSITGDVQGVDVPYRRIGTAATGTTGMAQFELMLTDGTITGNAYRGEVTVRADAADAASGGFNTNLDNIATNLPGGTGATPRTSDGFEGAFYGPAAEETAGSIRVEDASGPNALLLNFRAGQN